MTSPDTDQPEIRWIDRIDDLRALESEWQDLADRTRAEVYMRPAWLLTWWDHFGRDRKLACLALRKEGRLIGLLPFAIERVWIGPIPIRIARLAGTDPHCIVFQVPVEDEAAEFLWHEALRCLTRDRRCDAVSLTPVSDRATHLPLLRGISSKCRDLVMRCEGDGNHVVFELDGNFQNFLGKLSKNRRSHFRRKLRDLQASYGMEELEIIPDGAAFEEFADLHREQWQAVGRGGHFRDWPGSLPFYTGLADSGANEQPLRLFPLMGASGILASRFVLQGAGRAHFRLPARTLDPNANRFSLGEVSLLTSLNILDEKGLDLVEAGRGEYDYKISCGGQSVPVWRVLLFPDTALSRLRVKLLLWWSDLLNLVYYRIWFLKLSPHVQKRFGRRPRPLWRSWIRTRI